MNITYKDLQLLIDGDEKTKQKYFSKIQENNETCSICGKEFKPKRKSVPYCSPKCKLRYQLFENGLNKAIEEGKEYPLFIEYGLNVTLCRKLKELGIVTKEDILKAEIEDFLSEHTHAKHSIGPISLNEINRVCKLNLF